MSTISWRNYYRGDKHLTETVRYQSKSKICYMFLLLFVQVYHERKFCKKILVPAWIHQKNRINQKVKSVHVNQYYFQREQIFGKIETEIEPLDDIIKVTTESLSKPELLITAHVRKRQAFRIMRSNTNQIHGKINTELF